MHKTLSIISLNSVNTFIIVVTTYVKKRNYKFTNPHIFCSQKVLVMIKDLRKPQNLRVYGTLFHASDSVEIL